MDAYVTTAMEKLDAPNRRDAARKYLSQKVPQKLPSQSEPVAEPAETTKGAGGTGLAWLNHALFPIPMGGSANSLNVSEKVFYSARIALAGVVTLLAIATTFMGLLAIL